eukprot:TRINITY_DN42930_c0_g1_i1.p1 TRINITY_DN42930_c0_g1~~TRINITY_DN42930_c0_g1_i1.p1  ORF type:complete len:458 (+),score=130.93 TRINITY_DN42930_c0_g1_i1:82-1374(+)
MGWGDKRGAAQPLGQRYSKRPRQSDDGYGKGSSWQSRGDSWSSRESDRSSDKGRSSKGSFDKGSSKGSSSSKGSKGSSSKGKGKIPAPLSVFRAADTPVGAAPPKSVKAEMCKFWEKGHCKNGESCRFQHGPAETAKVRPPSNKRCKYFNKKGGCRDGENCPFRHVAADEETLPEEPVAIDQGVLEQIQEFVEENGGQLEGGQIGAKFPGVKKKQLEAHFDIVVANTGRGKYWVRQFGFDGPIPDQDGDVEPGQEPEEDVQLPDEAEAEEYVDEQEEADDAAQDEDVAEAEEAAPEFEGGSEDVEGDALAEELVEELVVARSWAEDEADDDDEYTRSLQRRVKDLRRELAKAIAEKAQHNGSGAPSEKEEATAPLSQEDYERVATYIEEHGGSVEGARLTNEFRFLRRSLLEESFLVKSEANGKFYVSIP